jgi:hypothetical protein
MCLVSGKIKGRNRRIYRVRGLKRKRNVVIEG